VYRGLWDSKKQAFESTEELVASGLKVASGDTTPGDDRGFGSRSHRTPWFRRGYQYASTVAAAVAAVLVVWWLIGDVHEPTPPFTVQQAFGPVKKAAEQATKRGSFVLPGGETAISAENGASYRSGYMPLDDELKVSLDSMFEAYRLGDYSEDLLYWLIVGHVATGQMKTAREIAGHARKLGIAGSRIVIIDAIIEYALGDYSRSERLLRDLLESDPDNCVAQINLAVVMMQQENLKDAHEILEHIVATCGNEKIRVRANKFLTSK
jgi:hypothetical protein